MDEPDASAAVINGPADKWHPIYDSVVEYLKNEAKPAPAGTPPLRNRRKPSSTPRKRRTT
jgi:hypothetical protein